MSYQLRHILLSIVPLALLAGFSISNIAQEQDPSRQPLNFSNLSLEISIPNKKDFIKLEPIPITLTLSNKTDQAILGHGALKFSTNLVKVFVTPAGGKTQEVQELSPFPKEVSVNAKEIMPGESFQVKELLSLDLNKIFPDPVEYQLYALVLDPNSKRHVKSNSLTIQVVEPEGMDRQAFEYIQKNSKSAELLSGRYLSGNPHVQDVLEKFVLVFSKTAYGDYAAFMLGELYFTQEEYNKASEQFNKVAEKSDFVFADKAKKYLAEAKEKQKQ